uniref:Uncharacterized protein n=1 Tax=Ananas comosus var. bracteatus TaxID=296719 RepID=A0A6V7PRV8_ANACO|nr:unnamed protein product [Ananas comosus var. bracteatus]
MDWLARYYATIDCGARTVTFRKPGQEEFTFRGCRSTLFATWISSARARQLMSRGCVAFLATVVEVPMAAPGLEDILIVREFSDVFPPELMTMPPEREIEFVIDVVPETAPISKAPYRMAPAELRELKPQLQDLMDNRHVRLTLLLPSRSLTHQLRSSANSLLSHSVSPLPATKRRAKRVSNSAVLRVGDLEDYADVIELLIWASYWIVHD